MDGQNAATEIEFFKTQPFTDIASALGYKPDRSESSEASTVLRHVDGDKVVVKLNDGKHGKHWVYFSVVDRTDHGTIVDFVQRRTGGTLGDVRKTIRDITGHNRTNPKVLLPIAQTPFPEKADPDKLENVRVCPVDPDGFRKKALAVWNAATWNPEHPYLLSRGLDRGTLADPRFADTYRQDNNGNVVFPNYDRGGMCGYERRGPATKKFGKDVKKGLWFTQNIRTASAIIVTEAPIDALSHSRLYAFADSAYCAYCAMGGSIGTRQRDLLAGLFAKADARNAMVIIGTDSDVAGDQFFEELALLAPMRLRRHRPIGKDWNEDLVFCNREQGGTSWN